MPALTITVDLSCEATNRRLDYLYASNSWIVVGGGAVSQSDPPSDHLPVVMVLSTREPMGADRPTTQSSPDLRSGGLDPVQIKAQDPVLPERLTGPVPAQGQPPRRSP